MYKYFVSIAFFLLLAQSVWAQVEVRTEAQVSVADGEHTPLWLNANKYGLSSLDDSGYLRAGVFKDVAGDTLRKWRLGYGADMALATGFTSTLIVQQAYGELGWQKLLLTVGSKEQPMEMKNQELSTGSQTLGINARPVPAVRLSLPDYWAVPGTKGWLSLKGHISYGMTTDDSWQKDFTHKQSRYTEHAKLHTKAGYVRIGHSPLTTIHHPPSTIHHPLSTIHHPLSTIHHPPFISLELGAELACQYGGDAYAIGTGHGMEKITNTDGLKGMAQAFFPSGSDAMDDVYKNAEGNHLGSMMARLNADFAEWGVSAYIDHFFEDHSQMFFFARDDYGTGQQWDEHVRSNYFVYDICDALLGVELRLKRVPWLTNVVAEYVYTKYQSGPLYHDHTKSMPDQVAGLDDYYNHHIFCGWQHWGQVMGNPLYRSPLYNDDGLIMVKDNRFWAWHLAASGDPLPGLHYRLMCTWQRGFGTYKVPLQDPQRNLSLLAEATYRFCDDSRWAGWSVKCGIGMDRGSLLGDNMGVQLTVGKRLTLH